MLDQRTALIAAIPAAGVALGLGFWLLLGREAFAARADETEARLSAIAPVHGGRRTEDLVAVSLNRPIFALTTGPGAVVEPALRLDGVSRSPSRTAALLSINGKPAQWIAVGATVEDVTILSVSGAGAEAETLIGSRRLKVGETSGPAPDAATAPEASGPDQIPPGFRSPPPPASAPVMGG